MNFEPVTPDRAPTVTKIDSPVVRPTDESMEILFDPYWLFQILLRHRFLGMIIFVVTLLASLFLFLKDPPKYQAVVKMKIEPKRPVFDYEKLTSFDLFSIEFYKTQIKLLQSRSLIRDIIQQVGMAEYLRQTTPQPDFLSSILKNVQSGRSQEAEAGIASSTVEVETLAINRYLQNFSVAPDLQAPQIITLKYTAPHPEFAATLVNLHAEYYIEKNMESNVVYTADYITNLEKMIADADIMIATQNQAILNYKKEHGFFQIQGMSSFDPVQDIDDRLSRVREQMAQTTEILTKAESNYEFLFVAGKIGDMDSVREDVIASDSLDKLRARRNELLQSWAEIKGKYGERHPQYVSLKSKLDAVDKSIREEVMIHVQRAKTALDEASATKEKLVNEEQDLIKEKYRRDSEWNSLKSMEKAKEQQEQQRVEYIRDIQNAKSSRETQQQTKNRTYEVVDPAEVASSAINRNWLKIILLSLAAALSLMATGVLLLELQDKSLRTPQQIEQLTGISVMGCIPLFKPGALSPIDGRIDAEESHTPAGESFIALRTRFLFSEMISQTQTVLLTSAIKNEGKSTISVNLASSISLVGKRVVLVDCDLRQPSLHRFFGEPVQPGLSDYLHDSETLENVLFETDMPGLFLIPAGSPVSSPSELLTSPSLDELILKLKEEFDFIIIDAPSVLATPDPTILSPRVDMTLLVIRSGKTVRDDLTSTLNHFRQTGGSVYSIILNGVPPVERGAYSRYGYGQSYYYEPRETKI